MFYLVPSLFLAFTVLPSSTIEVLEAARLVFEQSRYQTELPPIYSGLIGVSHAPTQSVQDDWSIQLSLPSTIRPLATVLRGLLWVGFSTGFVLLTGWAVREWRDYTPSGPPLHFEPGNRFQIDLSGPSLHDVQCSASTGQFAEAIRLLLHCALNELARQTRISLPVSLTSREILRATPMNRESKDAVGELVLAVELYHFAGRSPTRAEFERCMTRYQHFVASCSPHPA